MGNPRLRDVFPDIEATLAAGKLPIVVFDLDSTLFSTAERNLRILHEFAEEHEEAHPILREIVATVGLEDMGWNIYESLEDRGMSNPGVIEALKTYWFECFFTDDYCFTDAPTAGAPEYVTRIHSAGALIYYLSGRHVGGMELGTVRSLKEHGFPYWRGRCAVHLKPSFEMEDRAFKDEALNDIRSYHGHVVATFENEPGNANMFRAAFPDGHHYLLETVNAPNPEDPHEDLILTPDFTLS